MNFGALQGNIGFILRGFLGLFPKDIWLPILQGKARGLWWKRNSGVDGYWLGSYEYKTQRLFSSLIKDNYVVYDVGAHAGFYTLVAEKSAKNVRVFSYEPEPTNCANLKEHIKVNNLNAVAFNLALGNKMGDAKLKSAENSSTYRVSDEGINIRIAKLDEVLFAPPDIIKVDVEGGEYEFLLGAKETLKKYHPKLFIEIINKNTFDLLKGLGYELTKISDTEYYGKNTRTSY